MSCTHRKEHTFHCPPASLADHRGGNEYGKIGNIARMAHLPNNPSINVSGHHPGNKIGKTGKNSGNEIGNAGNATHLASPQSAPADFAARSAFRRGFNRRLPNHRQSFRQENRQRHRQSHRQPCVITPLPAPGRGRGLLPPSHPSPLALHESKTNFRRGKDEKMRKKRHNALPTPLSRRAREGWPQAGMGATISATSAMPAEWSPLKAITPACRYTAPS